MKKISGYGISILNNSNLVYTSSQTDWSKIRQGAFIKLGNNNFFNTISEVNEFFFIKDFTVENPTTISILFDEEKYENQILEKDLITISYKDYELDSIFEIKEKGQNYKKNSLLYIEGGKLSSSIMGNSNSEIILVVLEVGPKGELEKIGVKSRGKYLIPPSNNAYIRSEYGSGAIIDCDFRELSTRNKLEREILYIRYETGKVIIGLNYALPLNLKEGKLSINKYSLLLKEIYSGPTIINGNYFLSFDFTTNFNFPLMPPNCPHPEIVYNNFILKLDAILKEHLTKS